jgi:hypothetical protein
LAPISRRHKGGKTYCSREQVKKIANPDLSARSPNLVALQDVDVLPLPTKRNRIDTWDEKEWRIMISGCYHQALGAPAKKHLYRKDDVVIKIISDVFKISRRGKRMSETVVRLSIDV